MGQMRQAEQVEEAANAMPNPLRPVAVSSGLRLSLLDRERWIEGEKEWTRVQWQRLLYSRQDDETSVTVKLKTKL